MFLPNQLIFTPCNLKDCQFNFCTSCWQLPRTHKINHGYDYQQHPVENTRMTIMWIERWVCLMLLCVVMFDFVWFWVNCWWKCLNVYVAGTYPFGSPHTSTRRFGDGDANQSVAIAHLRRRRRRQQWAWTSSGDAATTKRVGGGAGWQVPQHSDQYLRNEAANNQRRVKLRKTRLVLSRIIKHCFPVKESNFYWYFIFIRGNNAF